MHRGPLECSVRSPPIVGVGLPVGLLAVAAAPVLAQRPADIPLDAANNRSIVEAT